jgi:hypothetical protein
MMKPGIFTGMVLSVFCILISISSCKNDGAQTLNENITTVKVVATNLANSHVDTFEYVNFNESKPNPPSYVDTVRLSPNSSYSIQVILLNEAPNPVQNMTDTIVARADNHLIIYNVDPAAGLISVKILDKDSKGLPLGLMSAWETSVATNGWLRLILRQQPGSKNGTETPGITDFEADFPVLVR